MVWVLTSRQDEVPEFRTRDLNEGGVSDAYFSLAVGKSISAPKSGIKLPDELIKIKLLKRLPCG
ncbi:MAG: hypothetical protein ACJAXZ_001415 [Akkermansiaceae bacterium]|jgi:hypothetical protein